MVTSINRAAGKRWEYELRTGLRDAGLDVEGLKLAGKNDEGDILVRFDNELVIIEAKNEARYDLARYVAEALAEADNFAAKRIHIPRSFVTGVAAIKRRGHNWKDAYILTTVREYFGLE